ncbi:MAG: hypothetical protein KatS3mg053_1546 [Candidatus Roseilinea sp.]|nr:MAG: hypothetical protein KatS3mg053_1546 [Candidatus Roseilinea sp.]
MTREADLDHSPLILEKYPLLADATRKAIERARRN